MRSRLLLLLLSLCLMSCARHSQYWNTIIDVESYIENKADSAMLVLENIDPAALSSQEEIAKYSLLYSIALDKNFVDQTDFNVIQPAIDYYKHYGTATDKLRTNYYKGRIFHNSEDGASALICYLDALDYGDKSNDTLTKARVYVALGNIYYDMMRWSDVCSVNLKAAELFYGANRVNSYVNCMIKAAGGYIQLGDYIQARYCLDRCLLYLDTIPIGLLNNYYSTLILYYVGADELDELYSILDVYISKIPSDIICYNTVALAYQKLGEYEKALELIQQVNPDSDAETQMRSYAILTNIYQQMGDYREAYVSYVKLNELHDAAVYNIFKHDMQVIEQRHGIEIENLKAKEEKRQVIIICVFVVMLFILYICYVRTQLKLRISQQTIAEHELNRYKLLCQQLEYEKDNLAEILSNNKDEDDAVRRVVVSRLDLLNKFFAASISHSQMLSIKVDKDLDELMEDRTLFMSSIRLAYAYSHPQFISYLENHNLTEREIEYCCLCALGLNGKEVGAYMQLRSHYNISSNIRNKFGLESSDTNLNIYIRQLLVSSK